MITAESAARIWECHREIETAKKLLVDIEEAIAEDKQERRDKPGRLRDVFGRRHDLQLGVPSGNDCHKLFGVSVKLGVSVIHAHIAHKQAELKEANEQARLELDIDFHAPVAERTE